ncbi:MAG TPA: glycosyltransferase 87 family protein, partial [Gaiellaceae bacterium]|nr:glycosyltransferase 87 family protein [Gaiellaceae bacterium]
MSELGGLLLTALSYSFPLFLLLVAVIPIHPAHAYAWDFRAFYGAGAAYLHLHTPYAHASLANLASQQDYVYPLPIAALFAPVSLVPYAVAAVLFIAASGLLLAAALRLLGVRDWRCYAAVFLGFPVQYGLKWGTISPLLAFL